jgi:MoaA/NifB/PqqE/SkfB family radical SAM enzyme
MAEATEPAFLESFARAGCRLFFLVEYVPVEPGGERLVLTAPQKASLEATAQSLRRRLGVECIAFPGDEERYGGCLAAGRGFIHVGPDGGLEPCPFAPYSDTSVADRPLKDALGSGFLRAIRENHGRLSETRGGCALWTNRDWVRSLLPGAAAGDAPAAAFPSWERTVEAAG